MFVNGSLCYLGWVEGWDEEEESPGPYLWAPAGTRVSMKAPGNTWILDLTIKWQKLKVVFDMILKWMTVRERLDRTAQFEGHMYQ